MILLAVSGVAFAYESDVHFGLTKWLAIQTGFEPAAADIIGTGNQRVDSGDMQFIELVLVYACAANDSLGERLAEITFHGGPPQGRPNNAPFNPVVLPRRKAQCAALTPSTSRLCAAVMESAAYPAGFLGASRHPSVPQPGQGLVCDPMRAWANPQSRGGWNSHKADLTMAWPSDVAAMAKATYDILVKYPMPVGSKQPAKAWDAVAVEPMLPGVHQDGKGGWFRAHRIEDGGSSRGSAPDGAESSLPRGRAATFLNCLRANRDSMRSTRTCWPSTRILRAVDERRFQRTGGDVRRHRCSAGGSRALAIPS
jgi:hypothetical protein